MKKSKIGKIVKYNLEKNLRNKWFIGLNAILLMVAIVALNFSTVKEILKSKNLISDDKKIKMEVVDKTSFFYRELEKQMESSPLVELQKVDEVVYDETMQENFVIVEVEESKEEILKARVISKDGIDQKYYQLIESSLESTKEKLVSNRYQITPTQIDKIKEKVSVERVMVGVDSSNSDTKQIAQTAVSYITLIILMLILSKIAGDISQEKVTKSIEYVLTSISAKDYLIAKVLSINLTMMIQVVFTFVYFLIATSIHSILNMMFGNQVISMDSTNFSLANLMTMLDSTMIVYILVVLVFLILTVLFMCIVQAALTSKTTNVSEAGNTTTILLMANFALYFVSTLVISPLKETSILIYILSCFPIISMYFVPAMIIIGQASVIQIVIATFVLIASIPLSLRICSKIFKNGVLDHHFNKKKEKEKEREDVKQRELAKIRKRELAKYGYVIGMSVILYVSIQFIFTYVLAMFVQPIYGWFHGKIDLDIIEMFMNSLVFIFSLLLPALFVRSYVEKEDKKTIKGKVTGKLVIMAVPVVFVIQIGLGWILEKLGLNYDIVDKIDLYTNKSVLSSILFFIYIAILPAIFEEFYIRKAVLSFSQKFGNRFAILASAILFAILHMNISQSLFAFLMGIILGVIALKTNRILETGIIHFLNNGYAALTMILEGNQTAITLINGFYIAIFLLGIILLVMSTVKKKEIIKERIKNLKEKKEKKKSPYHYIACDYTFLVACILMIVMLILTQKTIAIL